MASKALGFSAEAETARPLPTSSISLTSMSEPPATAWSLQVILFFAFLATGFSAAAASECCLSSSSSPPRMSCVWMFLTTFLKVILAMRLSPNSSTCVAATLGSEAAAVLALASSWASSTLDGDGLGGEEEDEEEDDDEGLGGCGGGLGRDAAMFLRRVSLAALTDSDSPLLVDGCLKMSTSISFWAFGTDCFTLLAGGGPILLLF